MSVKLTRIRLVLATATSTLICALGAAVPSASAGTGPSNVCSAVGAPSTTQTVGASGVFHVTVFTCGNAQATGFQQCANKTVAVPDVVHGTVYYCLPLQFTFGGNGVNQTLVVGGVGGISAGSG